LTVVVSHELLLGVKALGSLEQEVMELLWRGEPMSVREVKRSLGDKKAHTTVMTTLDRLFKKGLLRREREGTAYVYQAAMSREDYQRRLVETTVGRMLEDSAGSVLAAFVDTAAEIDEENLQRLEALIAARKGKRK
jgi:predicted transcriptional regulator